MESTLNVFLLGVILLNNLISEVTNQNTHPNNYFECTDKFCEDWTYLYPCEEQKPCNNTGFQTFLFPGPCNCCPYCYSYLKENDYCSLTDFGMLTAICGPYLTCRRSEDGRPTCQKMLDTECMRTREEYRIRKSEGRSGINEFLPECTATGEYAPRQCLQDSQCYCSDSKGDKIFGLTLDGSLQNCACSRDINVLKTYGFTHGTFPHCLSNGNYDELQCVLRSCFCQSDPSRIEAPQNITKLPCYDPALHQYDGTEYLYYIQACEYERYKLENEVLDAEKDEDIMIVADIPKCDPDGSYAPIQTYLDRVYCSDPVDKSMIENFHVNKFDKSAETMDCNCARARLLMKESAGEKPQCCKNGSYRPLQCRSRRCFCVNSLGHQNMTLDPYEVHEDFAHNLDCYEDSDC